MGLKFLKLFFLVPILTLAQPASHIIYVNSAPVGSCQNAAAIQRVISTGAVWNCVSGTWTLLSSGGSGTVTSVSDDGLGHFSIANPTTTPTLTFIGQSGDYSLSQITGTSGVPTITTGAGAPAGNCTIVSQPQWYYDTTNLDDWYCNPANGWRKNLNTTNSGVFFLKGVNGADPCGTVSAGQDCLSFNASDLATLKDSGSNIHVLARADGVNTQSGTNYAIVIGDGWKLVNLTNAGAQTPTLPNANTLPTGWYVDVDNTGAGTQTITPTTSTIDGATTLALTTNQGVRIFSNGTNYFTNRGVTGAGSGANVTVYNTHGANTFVKPATCNTAEFILRGAGGSGGGGAGGSNGAINEAGTGGGAGAYSRILVKCSDLNAPIVVTVGTGGAAVGAGVSGNAGTATTVTSNGLQIAFSGGGGAGFHGTGTAALSGGGGGGTITSGTNGGTGTAAGGQPGNGTVTALAGTGGQGSIGANGGVAEYGGGSGGGPLVTSGADGGSSVWGSGGGASGGIVIAANTIAAAGVGGTSQSWQHGGGGAAGVGCSTNACTGGNGANGAAGSSQIGGSGGGGGGACVSTTASGSCTAGTGGNGGLPGGGGGGGGAASTNAGTSTAGGGGSGADGLAIVIVN